ncbi:hypothetical protein G9A89_023701 [Geosiphon pyriformis]|nr:hypothetical protein G9A89_023701 [Geosiphon pyriformis]
MNVTIKEEGITVNDYDEVKVYPDNTTRAVEEDGRVNYYRLIQRDEPKDQLWRKKLGAALAVVIAEITGQTVETPILSKFPGEYKLYEHQTRKNPTDSLRTDSYLYGSTRFRSPKEFEPHLIWLAKSRQSPCECKYCTGAKTVPKGVTVTAGGSKNTPSTSLATTKKENDQVNIKNPIFRRGELVWVDIRSLSDPNLCSLASLLTDNSGKEFQLQYWPSVVHLRKESFIAGKNGSFKSYDHLFVVRLIGLSRDEQVNSASLRPWLSHKPRFQTNIFDQTTNINRIQNHPHSILLARHYFDAYDRALEKVRLIVYTYCPMKDYRYKEPPERLETLEKSERKRLEELGTCPHFHEIAFGAERIIERDMLRLLPKTSFSPMEGSSTMAKRKSPSKDNFFRVATIHRHPTKGVQFTGDIFELKGSISNVQKPKTLEDFEWEMMNTPEEEYTVDLGDIAGRFYAEWPDLEASMHVRKFKAEGERLALLDKDAPPIIEEEKEASLLMESRSIPSNKTGSQYELSHNHEELQEQKRFLVSTSANKNKQKKLKLSHSGQDISPSLELSRSHGERMPISTKTSENHRAYRKSSHSALVSLPSSSTNTHRNGSWRGKLVWPLIGTSLAGVPGFIFQNNPEGIQAHVYCGPINSLSRDIFNHFPLSLVISGITQPNIFQNFRNNPSGGELVCFVPDINYLNGSNQENFNTLACTLKNHQIAAFVDDEYHGVNILLISEDGKTITGLCYLKKPVQSTASSSSRSLGSSQQIQNPLKCIDLTTKQKTIIDVHTLPDISNLMRTIGERFNVSLDNKTCQQVRLRFVDHQKEAWYVIDQGSPIPVTPLGSKDHYTKSIKDIQEKAMTLMVTL